MKLMALLCFLFVSPVFAQDTAGSVADQVRTIEGCSLTHPATLAWRKPLQASWSGACVQGQAQGYGWYKYDLTNDGSPDWKVELFMEFTSGVVSNSYLYVKMLNNGSLAFEGFMDLTNHSIDSADCLSITDCARTADVLKNGTKPPQPPTPPNTPPPTEPNPPPHETRPVDPLADAQKKFQESWQNGLSSLLARFATDLATRQAITVAMNDFAKNYPVYAQNICQRNKRNLLNCAIFQYENARISLDRLTLGDSVQNLFFPVAGYVSRAKDCQKAKSNAEFLTCFQSRLDKDLETVAKNHPNGALYGSKALKGYAKALAFMDAKTGPSLTAATLDNYEHFLRFLMEQAERAWDN